MFPFRATSMETPGSFCFEGSVDQAVDDCTGLTGCVGLCVYPYCEKTGRKKTGCSDHCRVICVIRVYGNWLLKQLKVSTKVYGGTCARDQRFIAD